MTIFALPRLTTNFQADGTKKILPFETNKSHFRWNHGECNVTKLFNWFGVLSSVSMSFEKHSLIHRENCIQHSGFLELFQPQFT